MGYGKEARAASLSEAGAEKRRAEHDERLRLESLTLDEAAALTGSSRTRLLRLIQRGEVNALRVNGDIKIPEWQLQENELIPVVPGISKLTEAFPGGLASLQQWVAKPNVDLFGASPLEALRLGDSSRVIALARAIGAAGR